MEIITAILSGFLATCLTLLYTYHSQQRSFRIETALKIVEECDKLFNVYSKVRSTLGTKSSETVIKKFVDMHNKFSGDVMIALTYGKDIQIKKYREFRSRLFCAVIDMNQPNPNREWIDREEKSIAELKSELFKSLIGRAGIIYQIESFLNRENRKRIL